MLKHIEMSKIYTISLRRYRDKNLGCKDVEHFFCKKKNVKFFYISAKET